MYFLLDSRAVSNVPTTRVLRVAFQGSTGAYSHIAARDFFGATDAEFIGHHGFRPMLEAIESGDADYAVLPLENSTAGSVNEAYDLMAEMELALVGEVIQTVEHCLIGLAGATVDGLKRIYSHPQALAQCRRFLDSLESCVAIPFSDTASAVDEVLKRQDPQLAAIASAEAASNRQATVLRRDINNQAANFTRMVIVASTHERRPVPLSDSQVIKTSLTWITKHERGALLRCLAILDQHEGNLSKLESRPILGKPWVYRFYVDVELPFETDLSAVIADLKPHTEALTYLGTYPKAQRPVPSSPPPPFPQP